MRKNINLYLFAVIRPSRTCNNTFTMSIFRGSVCPYEMRMTELKLFYFKLNILVYIFGQWLK